MNVQQQIHSRACVIGVDPGQSGAVVRLGNSDLRCWRGFKTLRQIVSGVEEGLRTGSVIHAAVIEKTAARPGQGVCSMHSFGRSTGVALGPLLFHFTDDRLLQPIPQVWQNWVKKEFGLGKMAAGTFDSRKVVEKYFPQQYHKALSHRRGLDHNACDAALMALWGMNQICPKN